MGLNEYRETDDYKAKKLAYELVTSPVWTDYLLPQLTRLPVEMLTSFETIGALTEQMHLASKRKTLESLRRKIERQAAEFLSINK